MKVTHAKPAAEAAETSSPEAVGPISVTSRNLQSATKVAQGEVKKAMNLTKTWAKANKVDVEFNLDTGERTRELGFAPTPSASSGAVTLKGNVKDLDFNSVIEVTVRDGKKDARTFKIQLASDNIPQVGARIASAPQILSAIESAKSSSQFVP